ncbi:Cytochrome c biogenesis protein Ccs1 [Candidatus Xiphinematobacter sp. Idaho Grape]|uniref:cytochrome c biogenesis protein ResB n=1 Tax=Candidatus Xiphinematobacter sp. Idaho Grape TaxID=1704307 RepID=UPI0007068F6F|nr:cytochrome c biogenesis protein ResB [Candidatus Xiphinematobacter sp. Idaho Grape]ALJ56837.1 Cytochrome c biogenesis protein Ccs1 [Candidatus Xiphinematobacter sp. Idaho Grape]
MRNSPIWKLIYLFGSLKLALVLLATLAAACAVATFTESNFSIKLAQATVYKAPWFTCWLALLCINLLAVTLTRWPWQRKHIGFVITHFGIVTLLVGALVGSTWGFEGNVTLRVDDAPTNQVTTSRNVVQVEDSTDGRLYWMDFDAEMTPPSPRRLRRFAVPGTSLTIVANDLSTSLRSDPELLAASDAPPAILLEFSSSMIAVPIRVPLSLGFSSQEFDFFRLANILFLPKLPKRISHVVSESHMIFSHHPPIKGISKENTGWEAMLNPDGSVLTLISPTNQPKTLKVSEHLGHSIQTDFATIRVEAFWPDFRIHNGKPASASCLPKNPAVLLRISAPSKSSSYLPLLEIAPHSDNRHILCYQLSRGGTIYASGSLTSGDSFHTGWGDWKATLLDFLPSASLASRLTPSANPGITGFRAYLQSKDGLCGPSAWIGPGVVTTLLHRDGLVRITYGLSVRRLPFNIRLRNFVVPRYEGTDIPSDYISLLDFQDDRTGTRKQTTSKMNHPASFPDGWWRTLTGWNYKFSQAQWDPTDLRETTLQVLYDPGWLFKWSGSFAICVGIFTMFYFTHRQL